MYISGLNINFVEKLLKLTTLCKKMHNVFLLFWKEIFNINKKDRKYCNDISKYCKKCD